MKLFMRALLWVLLVSSAVISAQAQSSVQAQTQEEETALAGWNLKTNLLYDLTTTINLGVEFRTGEKTSLDIPFNYNPWTFSENRKLKNFLVQPELRWWPKGTFNRHFWGVHAHYAFYNMGNLPNGPFSKYMEEHRFQGSAVGVGVSYGYRWNFRNPRWAVEATVGVGYAYLNYDQFDCMTCGEKLISESKNYFGPTKVGISLIYNIGGKRKNRRPDIVYVPIAPVPVPVERVEPVVREPQITVIEVIPEPVEVVIREHRESGKAYLDFAVGRSEIAPYFMNNAAELRKIDDMIERIKDDPSATIIGITIMGWASPEGGWQMNSTLSEGRAAALKERLKTKYGFAESIFTTNGAGEDWTGLEELVGRSDIPERGAALDIIRSNDPLDQRESRLARLGGGEPYRRIKAELFPQLRRVEYEIRYTTSNQ